MNHITPLLTPLVFESNEEQTHNARLLYMILWTLILLVTLVGLGGIIVLPENTPRL